MLDVEQQLLVFERIFKGLGNRQLNQMVGLPAKCQEKIPRVKSITYPILTALRKKVQVKSLQQVLGEFRMTF